MSIVVDTNIFISALIKKGITRDIIVKSKQILLFPEFELEEILSHKQELIEKSRLSEREFNTLLLRMLNYVRIVPTDIVIEYREQAQKIISKIDPDTNFMLLSEYMKTRSSRDIKAVMVRLKERTGEQIKVMTTDGWNAYEKTIKKVFGYSLKEGKFNVFHNRVVVSDEQGNFNHPIERLHNNARARTKVMRGFHGSISSANAIMKGFEIYYNFINKHQAINKCPYELATALKLNNPNKWLELIHKSRIENK